MAAANQGPSSAGSRAGVNVATPSHVILTSALLLLVLPSELGAQPAAIYLQLPISEGGAASSSAEVGVAEPPYNNRAPPNSFFGSGSLHIL